jgi:type VI secretion system secreted protein VgrG
MHTHLAQRSGVVSRRRAGRLVLLATAAMALAAFPTGRAEAAQAPINLGTAAAFSVLAGSAITNTGASVIVGDVGSSPTPSITGFGTVVLNGTNHGGDAVTQQAKIDLTAAYIDAAGANPATVVPTELGGRTLEPGVYGAGTLGITGVLTLNPLGDPNAVFIFQASSTLITASASSILVVGGASLCNVFWQVGSSATLGSTSSLIGSVLAQTSISTGAGALIQGRLLAQTGAVTMDSTTITPAACAIPPATTTTAAPTSTTAAPTPTTAAPSTGPLLSPSPALAPPTGPLVPTVAPPFGTPTQIGTPPGGSPPPTVPPTGGGGSPPGRPPLARTGLSTDVVRVGLTALVVGAVLVAGTRRSRPV